MDVSFRLAENAELMHAGRSLLQGEEGDRIAAFQSLHGVYRTFENQFYAYKEGSFSESSWLGYRVNIVVSARQPNVAAFWNDYRRLYSAEFKVSPITKSSNQRFSASP